MLFVMLCALLWRFGGGALTVKTGFSLGTRNRWLPDLFGLTEDAVPYDLAGMAKCGLLCTAALALVAP